MLRRQHVLPQNDRKYGTACTTGGERVPCVLLPPAAATRALHPVLEGRALCLPAGGCLVGEMVALFVCLLIVAAAGPSRFLLGICNASCVDFVLQVLLVFVCRPVPSMATRAAMRYMFAGGRLDWLYLTLGRTQTPDEILDLMEWARANDGEAAKIAANAQVSCMRVGVSVCLEYKLANVQSCGLKSKGRRVTCLCG